jgi:hypothetical protein
MARFTPLLLVGLVSAGNVSAQALPADWTPAVIWAWGEIQADRLADFGIKCTKTGSDNPSRRISGEFWWMC